MGFFSWIKHAFTNNISLSENIDDRFLYHIDLKKNRIKVDSKVTVKNGHIFATGIHGKALDYLPVGTHYLSAVTLPKCSKKFKLYKLDDNGKKKKYFKVEAYYINLGTFDAVFQTDKIELKDEKYGIYTARYSGKYNFSISSHKKLFETIYGMTSCKKAYQEFRALEEIANEYLTELLRKANFSVDDNKNFSQELRTFVSENFQKKIFDIGLNLNNFEITDIIFNKRLMKKLNMPDVRYVNEDGKDYFDKSIYNKAFHLPEENAEKIKEENGIVEEPKEEPKEDSTWINELTKDEEEHLHFEEPELPKPKKYAYEKYTESKQEEKKEEVDTLEERKKEGMFSTLITKSTPYYINEPKKNVKSEKTIRAEKNIEFALFGEEPEEEVKEQKVEEDKRATSKTFVNLSLDDDNPIFLKKDNNDNN